MLYEFSGVCQSCATQVAIRIHNDKLIEKCPGCGEEPFSLRRYKGLVYIISNPNQTGVKIGMTETSLENRMKQLSSATGVPGKFVPIVIFPSDNPKKDEKKVHDKLAKYKLAKEHFEIGADDAALAAYRALNRREAIFYNEDVKGRFNIKLKQAALEMDMRLRGKNTL